MIAIGKYLRIKHKKAQVVASMIIGENANTALDKLRYIPRKAAGLIYKVLKSALSNAEHNFKKDTSKLIVKEVIVNKGPGLKRIRPVSRGRAHRIIKGVAHIRVTLEEQPVTDTKKVVKKSVKTKEAKKETKIVKSEKKPVKKKTVKKKSTSNTKKVNQK